jgi:glycosyltransferase involved in cell wall biosynthesis
VLGEGHRQELGGSLAALKKDYVTEAQPAIALVHSPFWWPVVNDVAEAFSWPVVYDCMDLHAGFSTANPILLEYERELLTRAQLVVASSAVLEAQARRFNQNVLLLRNGCDYEHFSRVRPKPRKGRPIIGYYGAIAEWFDTDLVTDLARRRPDWDFILVGSTHGADIRRLQQLPNVSLPGEKPYSELLMWLARFDVAILPFKRNPLTEAANPVKAYEILAAGKPLVSVPLPEIRTFGHLVRVATAVGDFERQIELELCHPEGDLKSRRQVFAKENSWDRRFDLLRRGIRPTGSNNFRNSRPKVGIPIQFGCETNMQ